MRPSVLNMEYIVGRSIPEPNSGCWLWLGDVSAKGYGRFSKLGSYFMAHRLSWEVANNAKIPAGMFICHKCDVRLCVNPDHLFLGTIADNNADMIRKGRNVRGETSPAAKLTTEQVMAIQRDRRPQRVIAAEYGVGQTLISNIRNGKRWVHLVPAEIMGEMPAHLRRERVPA